VSALASVRVRSAFLFVPFLIAAKCGELRPFNGLAVDPLMQAPALALRDSAGGRFDLAHERGHVVLLFFGYTRCPDVCPTTLADWSRVKRELGRQTDRVRFVFVSVDRERDSPADVQRYVDRFDGSFVGLTGDANELRELQRRYGITSQPIDPTTGAGMDPSHMTHDTPYAVAHSTQTFVIDKRGRLKLLFGVGMERDRMVSDLRRLAGQ